ncbi:MAG: hypothetical protein IPP74_07570 [Alphaproteobacteria bacterium]|nr:hypothetical protein [Alphaproteobacteria bacterium]
MSDLARMLENYRLTTAEILYHLPDHPSLLQTYVWQEYDISPEFPNLKHFLHFWERELDGRLHSVQIAHGELIQPSELIYVKNELRLH